MGALERRREELAALVVPVRACVRSVCVVHRQMLKTQGQNHLLELSRRKHVKHMCGTVCLTPCDPRQLLVQSVYPHQVVRWRCVSTRLRGVIAVPRASRLLLADL